MICKKCKGQTELVGHLEDMTKVYRCCTCGTCYLSGPLVQDIKKIRERFMEFIHKEKEQLV